MPPFLCTLTGVDDATPLDRLVCLSREFPFLEIGVLYSESQAGTGRYPSKERIRALAEAADGPAKMALHVCGRAVADLIVGKGEVSTIANAFPRIQINFIYTNHDIAAVRRLFLARCTQTLITQHNEANRDLWKLLAEHHNHAVLFDASGGRGIAAAEWPALLPETICGYAGGLGPDTLADELPRIESAAGGARHWIDMEGKLRADDAFDLEKCRRVLEIVSSFAACKA